MLLTNFDFALHADKLSNPVYFDSLFKNHHQIHNLLHQMSISFHYNDIDKLSEQAPDLVVKIQNIANSFCSKENLILRLNDDCFEVALGLCVHKASVLFKKSNIFVEYSEAPNVVGIGRLKAFKILFENIMTIRKNTFVQSSYCKENAVWKFYVNIRVDNANICDYIWLMQYIKSVLDSSYDFSGTTIKTLCVNKKTIKNDRWNKFIVGFVDYHARLPAQKTDDIKSYLVSHFFTWIFTEPDFLPFLLYAMELSFGRCIELFISYEEKLNSENYRSWRKYYLEAIVLMFVLCVNWKKMMVSLDDELKESAKTIFSILELNLF